MCLFCVDQIGDYAAAIDSSLRAVRANERLVSRGIITPFYSGYMLHDYHMLVYAAMLAANESVTLIFVTVPATVTWRVYECV